ncbi:MAG: MarR family winged helix-turn-helix transcriptional regulator [Lentilactobacillus buchneri]|jgi:DNA-binding MarR family transcriptional regulator|nr:MarR family winged helix-turn-helix transcriptional regulator [Lentilactobacillus buchneri]
MAFNEDQDFIQQLAQLNHEMTDYLNHHISYPNINANNYFYLLKLLSNPNIIQNDFSSLVKLNQSTITRSVNALEKNGYLMKHAATDKRSHTLQLTESGTTAAKDISALIDDLNNNILACDPKIDVATLIQRMRQLNSPSPTSHKQLNDESS